MKNYFTKIKKWAAANGYGVEQCEYFANIAYVVVGEEKYKLEQVEESTCHSYYSRGTRKWSGQAKGFYFEDMQVIGGQARAIEIMERDIARIEAAKQKKEAAAVEVKEVKEVKSINTIEFKRYENGCWLIILNDIEVGNIEKVEGAGWSISCELLTELEEEQGQPTLKDAKNVVEYHLAEYIEEVEIHDKHMDNFSQFVEAYIDRIRNGHDTAERFIYGISHLGRNLFAKYLGCELNTRSIIAAIESIIEHDVREQI